MKRYSLVFLAVLWSTCYAYGQAVGGNVEMESSNKPNASKGDIGGNIINVDHYTGTGSVSVPIYSNSIDGINFDVSLGYNLKGVRVDEVASMVGLGWNLSAGGEITRQVNGSEDEVTLPAKFKNSNWTSMGFPYHDSIQGILVPNVLTQAAQANLSASQLQVYDDDEPDAFYFNLCGRQVTVYFEPGATYTETSGFRTEPFSRLKIQMISSCYDATTSTYTDLPGVTGKGGHKDNDRDVLRFIVTDEQGNKFYFNRGDYQIKKMDLSVDAFYNNDGEYIPTEKWRLDSVITYTGQHVYYHYSAPSTVSYVYNITETSELEAGSLNQTLYFKYKKDVITLVKTYLDEIVFPNNTVVSFDYHTASNARCDCAGERRLRKISVTNCTNDLNTCNTIVYQLQHAYFNAPSYQLSATEIALPGTSSPCSNITANMASTLTDLDVRDSIRTNQLSRGLRLKLNGITRTGFDGTTTEPYYTFTYNSTPLPPRFAPGKDMYGYANGIMDSIGYPDLNNNVRYRFFSMPHNSTCGHYPAELPSGATSREHNFTYAQSSVLNKIENASGGMTEVEFVNYTLVNPDSSYSVITDFPGFCGADPNDPTTNLLAGVVLKDAIDADLQFTDQNDGLVVGKITRKDKFIDQSKTVTEYTYTGGERFNRGGYTWVPNPRAPQGSACINQNNFVNPMLLFNGSNHGFSQVTVKTFGYNNEQLGMQKLYFTNLMYKENYISKSSMKKPTGKQFHTIPGEFNKTRMGLNYLSESYDASGFMSHYQQTNFAAVSYGAGIHIARYLSYPYPSGTTACSNVNFKYPYRINDTFNVRMDSTISVKRSSNAANVVTEFKVSNRYNYDAYNHQVSQVFWSDSKGKRYKKAFTYTQLSDPEFQVGSEVWDETVSSDRKLLKQEVSAPRFLSGGFTQIPVSFETATERPIAAASVASSVNLTNALAYPNNASITSFGTKLMKTAEITQYDNASRALETYSPIQDAYNSQIWDNITGLKIASVSNARYADIAHSSFESSYATGYTGDANKGNLIFDPAYIVTGGGSGNNAMTGKRTYKLQSATTITKYLRTNGLNAGTYLFSFWAACPNAPVVERYTGTTPTTITCTVANTVGNWKLYTASVTATAADFIQVRNQTGTGLPDLYIDEVRLYPKGAAMLTNTYQPLSGMSSMCDPTHYIVYYEYDAFGRLIVTKDMRGNIITKKERGLNSPDTN